MTRKRPIKPPRRGVRMVAGHSWRLQHGNQVFAGTLLTTLQVGRGRSALRRQRIAIFSVPKR